VRWLVAGAVALPIAIMIAIGIVSWRANWHEAERELSRSADAVAEYVLRVLEGHRVAADRANDVLAPYTNEQIQERERELHERLSQLLPDFPLVQTLAVSRPDGLMLVTANVYPIPSNTIIADREWIRDLIKLDAPRTHVSRVTIGRLDRNLFFGVSRRRVMAKNRTKPDAHDGVINVSLDPNRVAGGFADLVSEASDLVIIVRTDGEILARRPGFADPLPPLNQTTDREVLQHVSGTSARESFHASLERINRLMVLRPIPKFPVVAIVARDHQTTRARWWGNFSQHLSLGVPAILLMGAMAIFAIRRAEEHDQAQAAARFHAVFDASPIGMAVIDVKSDEVIASNKVFSTLTQVPAPELEPVRIRFRSLLPPEFVDRYTTAVDDAASRGVADPLEIDLIDRRRPVRISMSSLPGTPARLVLAVQDISEQREIEARRELMMRELEHRSKNTLSVVQAALRLGASTAVDAQALAKAVEARVAALARSQSMLTSVGDKGASLQDLIEQEVAPLAQRPGEARNLVIEGPPIKVTPKAGQALILTFHELATNAAKYGAFSVPQGSIRVSWHIDDKRNALCISWIESGTSGGLQPKRTGFGTRLIDTNVEHQLGGTIARRWSATGLALDVCIPLEHVLVGKDSEAIG
jgi:two-component sensor histidine kinase